MNNLKKHLNPIISESIFATERERKEIFQIVHKLLSNHYNKEVVIESLLHKASFDRDVFHRYFQKSLKDAEIGCYKREQEKANAIGFNQQSIFGGELVMLVEFFINNQKE